MKNIIAVVVISICSLGSSIAMQNNKFLTLEEYQQQRKKLVKNHKEFVESLLMEIKYLKKKNFSLSKKVRVLKNEDLKLKSLRSEVLKLVGVPVSKNSYNNSDDCCSHFRKARQLYENTIKILYMVEKRAETLPELPSEIKERLKRSFGPEEDYSRKVIKVRKEQIKYLQEQIEFFERVKKKNRNNEKE